MSKQKLNKDILDTVIVGSGPAGMTASIYAQRAGMKTVVITGLPWGGNLMLTHEVENFPGFAVATPGPEILGNIRKQAENLGVKFEEDIVTQISGQSPSFTVFTQSGKKYYSKTVIIASGAKFKKLGVPGEDELTGKGVSFCATCDGAFFRDKNVAVVGGGNSAAVEALFLTKFAKKVYLIHRRNKLRAVKALETRLLNNPKIDILWSKVVASIQANQQTNKDRLGKLVLQDTETEAKSELEVEGVFVAIGYIPNSAFVKGFVSLDKQGYIEKTSRSSTSVPGVFVAGDVSDPTYQQAITASGEGAKAAMDAQEYLEERTI